MASETVTVIALFLCLAIAGCVPQVPEADASCPCTDEWVCDVGAGEPGVCVDPGARYPTLDGAWVLKTWMNNTTLPYSSTVTIEGRHITFDDGYMGCAVTLFLELQYTGERKARADLRSPNTKTSCTPERCELTHHD